jgi:6-phosphogluconolactonase
LDYDAADSRLTVRSIAATTPDMAMAGNHCSEIAITRDGRWLYVGNRGHDSLARFSIDEATGAAVLLGHTPSGGKTPRHFAFDPSGAYLAVANQDSDSIAVFAVDRANGDLTMLPAAVHTGTPTSVAFVRPAG